MKTYIISYISNSGFTMLNHVVEASSFSDSIDQIKGDTGVYIILSCVCKSNNN